jgi:AraC family transcriptional regulator
MHKFLTKVRVRNAEALLARSDLPVGDIALDCGFATIQHFSRVFKELRGQTPIEFRRGSLSSDPPGIAADARVK